MTFVEELNNVQGIWKCEEVKIFCKESDKWNFIYEEIKGTLNSGNAYEHLVSLQHTTF